MGAAALSEPVDKKSCFGDVTSSPVSSLTLKLALKAHLRHLQMSFLVPLALDKIITVIRASDAHLVLFISTYLCLAFQMHSWLIPQHMKQQHYFLGRKKPHPPCQGLIIVIPC